MEENKGKSIDLVLTPLSLTDQGLLKGGFVTIPGGDHSLAVIRNGNCSSGKALLNGNCGCRNCGPKRQQDGPPTKGGSGSGAPPEHPQ